jgi:hypothetical protein
MGREAQLARVPPWKASMMRTPLAGHNPCGIPMLSPFLKQE